MEGEKELERRGEKDGGKMEARGKEGESGGGKKERAKRKGSMKE